MSIRDFRDLEVYQRCSILLPTIKRLRNKLEPNYRELAKNLLKTACQIGPEIAEGYAKKSSVDEFKRYLTMAIGTANEMIAHLEQVPLLAPEVNQESIRMLIQEYERIAKQIQVLKKSWK